MWKEMAKTCSNVKILNIDTKKISEEAWISMERRLHGLLTSHFPCSTTKLILLINNDQYLDDNKEKIISNENAELQKIIDQFNDDSDTNANHQDKRIKKDN